MSTNRLFNLLIALALVVVVALTVREAAATSIMVSKANSANQSECSSLPSRYSLHSEYVEEMGTSVMYSEDGPTGVDGGVIYLLSAYRTCSR